MKYQTHLCPFSTERSMIFSSPISRSLIHSFALNLDICNKQNGDVKGFIQKEAEYHI